MVIVLTKTMPYSRNQKIAATIALAARKGKVPRTKLKGASLGMYRGMTKAQLEDFATSAIKKVGGNSSPEVKIQPVANSMIQQARERAASIRGKTEQMMGDMKQRASARMDESMEKAEAMMPGIKERVAQARETMATRMGEGKTALEEAKKRMKMMAAR